jgi:hypothetical protein
MDLFFLFESTWNFDGEVTDNRAAGLYSKSWISLWAGYVDQFDCLAL